MTHPNLMRGFSDLREHIAGFLEAELPPLIDVARAQWLDANTYSLPYPKKYDWYDMSLVNKYPAIGLVAGSDSRHGQRTDLTDQAANEIRSRYNVRMFIMCASPYTAQRQWVGGDAKSGALRLRDDMLRLVQAALLETPNLKRDDVLMDKDSMESTYLEPLQISTQNKRWVAAALLSADFDFTEYTRGDAYGVVSTTTVHPAFM